MKIENVETLFVMTPAFAALLKTAETYIRLRKSPYITITEESIAKTQNRTINQIMPRSENMS